MSASRRSALCWCSLLLLVTAGVFGGTPINLLIFNLSYYVNKVITLILRMELPLTFVRVVTLGVISFPVPNTRPGPLKALVDCLGGMLYDGDSAMICLSMRGSV
jgi:hypothetical protein